MEQRTMRIARILLDYAILHDMLRLPDGMRILAQQIDPALNCVVLFVESEELPRCEAGAVPPEIYMIGHIKQEEDGTRWYRTTVKIPEVLQLLKSQESGEV